MNGLVVTQAVKSFGTAEVLKGVDLVVGATEVAALIGASGSGKSTLLRCINGLETLDGGSILLNDTPLPPPHSSSLRSWREHVGFVFQSFNLFQHLTAAENVALPLRLVKGASKSEAATQALELLNSVGLVEHAGHYPDELSGGQQQRVAIARAVGLKPDIMLFDEPTSALDPELTGEVLDAIALLAEQGMTMLVVSHELRFVRKLASRVHFMHGGQILESGRPEEIFNTPSTDECERFVRTIHE